MSLLCLSVILCTVLTPAQAIWDDTIAPLNIEPNNTGASHLMFHMAHFGQIPYGSDVSGCASPVAPTCKLSPALHVRLCACSDAQRIGVTLEAHSSTLTMTVSSFGRWFVCGCSP